MTAPVYDVLILGAGFTGTALAIQLARGLPAGSRVLLLGTPKATGRGLAYGTDNPDHLLNVRAERMSLFPDDPDHFVRWLEARQPGKPAQRGAAESYAPRHLYGRYVRDCLHQAIAEARCARARRGARRHRGRPAEIRPRLSGPHRERPALPGARGRTLPRQRPAGLSLRYVC